MLIQIIIISQQRVIKIQLLHDFIEFCTGFLATFRQSNDLNTIMQNTNVSTFCVNVIILLLLSHKQILHLSIQK